jgi:excisionase family DNA binding protein
MSSPSPLQALLNQPFYSPIELAAILKLHKLTVYRMLKDGSLPGKKVNGAWRTGRAELLEYLEKTYGRAGNESDS